MALFDRDYDRDYAYRNRGEYRAGSWNRDYGQTGRGGYDRDMGDRMRGGWNRMKHETKDFFGMDEHGYDRGYRTADANLDYDTMRYRAGGMPSGSYNTRNYLNQSTRGYTGDYDRGMGYRSGRSVSGMGAVGYDRGMSSATGYDREVGIGYGSEYKTRQQTDTGDPFGDRQNRTPIRMIRDRDDNDWGNWGDRDRGRSMYDRDYSTNPMSYEPYRPASYGYDRNF